MIKDFNLENG